MSPPEDIRFLPDLTQRSLSLPDQAGLKPVALYIGEGQSALEVAVVSSNTKPTASALQRAWKERRGGRASPLLLIALTNENAALCGPTGESPPVRFGIDRGQAERLCHAALRQPDRHAALTFLGQALPSLDTPIPGLRNEGLFALHALSSDLPRRPEWLEGATRAKKAASSRGQELLSGLGFQLERLDNLTLLLRGADKRTALGVLLDPSETPEAGTARFNSLSPVSYALAKADAENLPWVIVVQDDRLRLYPTAVGVGVGRRGRTETYVELQTSLLSDESLAYLWLLFSSEALSPDGSVATLLDSSSRFAGDLAERLRERIYDDVVPRLARGIFDARGIESPKPEDLDFTYRMALTLLFRLLFIAYAEDRDLLPYDTNDAYRRRSLKQKALELVDTRQGGRQPGTGSDHWYEVQRLCRAVAVGQPEWGVPAYDGGLFTSDSVVSRPGAELENVSLADTVFEPALESLLLIETPEGHMGPVDFRSLGVREFGTIYEGLLESELSVADQDLSLDSKGHYVPQKGHNPVEVAKGGVYLHNRSGARKSSGSYFTKSFAVEHLLDRALEPAIDDHLERVDALEETDAAEALFVFRVADIAMGSGHFLVAAIDRIERRFADYLNRRSLPGVRQELTNLREAARKELGEDADEEVIEDGQLLRRLIARRCIYGVDLNPIAVELARLSIWIHTFVPGLPMTMLEHSLVCGNALIGIGTLEEIRERFEEAEMALFPVDADNLLGDARKPLNRLSRLADATLKDVAAARRAMEEARLLVGPTNALCDIVTGERLDSGILFQPETWADQKDRIQKSELLAKARKAADGLRPLHFPIAFPEVFLGRRPGFNVILGNPPWDKVKTEEHGFWARHFPGLRGLSQREAKRRQKELQEERPDLVDLFDAEVAQVAHLRAALLSSAFPGMGTGDPDLYKAFYWRFWKLVAANGGRIGVVLPRSALAAKGSAEFREEIFTQAADADVTMLLNNRKWVFSDVHPQYTIGLIAITRGEKAERPIALRGPFTNRATFDEHHNSPGARLSAREVKSWTDTAALPLLPTEESLEIFLQLRNAPRLDSRIDSAWRARPARNETETTNRELMDLVSSDRPEGFWPVYGGDSFDLWLPDTGKYYAWADPDVVLPWLFEKRIRANRASRDSVHKEFSIEFVRDEGTLAPLRPRVAFRDVSRATDTRTVRAALLPPRVFTTENCPFFLFPRGDASDEAFLLGVLSSIPLDWYARRWAETHLRFHVINPFPIPRPDRNNERWRRTVALAGRLACPDERFAKWAEAVGIDHGPLEYVEKEDMIAELDAVVAHLYGLTERQLVHIFETFHEGWDYEDRLRAVLGHFREWARKSD